MIPPPTASAQARADLDAAIAAALPLAGGGVLAALRRLRAALGAVDRDRARGWMSAESVAFLEQTDREGAAP